MVKTKRAIAMIELIFSLVIMGIVLMSAPMLIQQSIKSANVALQQEAISAAAAQTSIILSMHWDENNTNLPAGVSPILNTGRAPFAFNTTAPRGIIGVSSRNSTDGTQTLIPTVVTNFGASKDAHETVFTDFDDVDDYDNSSFGLMVFNHEDVNASIGEYVDIDINISSSINYTDDTVTFKKDILDADIANISNSNSVATASNIKFINVNLTSDSGVDELNKNITMQAFSCNIGTYSIEGRSL